MFIIGTVQLIIQGLVLSLHHLSGKTLTLPDCCPVPPMEGQDEADVPLAGAESGQLGCADRTTFTSQHFSWRRHIQLWKVQPIEAQGVCGIKL